MWLWGSNTSTNASRPSTRDTGEETDREILELDDDFESISQCSRWVVVHMRTCLCVWARALCCHTHACFCFTSFDEWRATLRAVHVLLVVLFTTCAHARARVCVCVLCLSQFIVVSSFWP